MDVGVDVIRRWHVDGNGWSDVGYHYVIDRRGRVENGRDEMLPGAHTRGHNSDSIGVCLVGGVNGDGIADCNFTKNQWHSLEQVIESLLVKYPGATVKGHRDYDKTKACPTFDVSSWHNQ